MYNLFCCPTGAYEFPVCGTLLLTMNANIAGFPKLVCLKAKAGKILFGPVKPTNVSVLMFCKGQSTGSFGKPDIT